MKRKNLFYCIVFLAILLQNCSVSKMATKNLGNALSNQQSQVFTGDDDPELVKDALPFTMKFYETILEKDSTNPELYLATGKLFCLYAQAFVLFPADTLPDSDDATKRLMKKRAKRLLLRSRDYVLRGLELRHPGFNALLKSQSPDSALAMTTAEDTSFLYWGSAAWMGAIIADRSDFALGMTIKKAASLMEKVLQLSDNFDNGAAHEILCMYKAAVPKSLGGSNEKAKEHIEKAISYSSGKKISPYVTYATSLSLKDKNRDEYVDMLQKALSIKIQNMPSMRLQNTIYQQRAKWLLSQTDHYFPPADSLKVSSDPRSASVAETSEGL